MNPDSDYQKRLHEFRTEIDALDREIVALLLRRLRVTARIGGLRKSQGMREIGEHDRAERVLARYRRAGIVLDDAGTVSLEAVGRAILEQSSAVQRLIIG